VSSGYLICAECGARIKADREYCLRCGEVLRGVEAPMALHEAFGISQGQLQILGIVLSLAALGGAAAIWEFRPKLEDEMARPADRSVVPKPRAAAPAAPLADTTDTAEASNAPRAAFEPVTSLDATRVGGGAFTNKDFEAAKAAYEQALQKKPDDAEALNSLGLSLERMGRVGDAVPRFERAATLVPDKWAYRFNLAHAVGQLGQWDRAVTEYREAARIFPTDYATQYNLAMALHKKGDEEAAVPEFQKAIVLAPSEPSFHVSLGISLEKLGRIADAVREYRAFLEMEPSAPEAASLKAHVDALNAQQARGQRGPSTREP
jgi:Flp pilus assembly protein TadD